MEVLIPPTLVDTIVICAMFVFPFGTGYHEHVGISRVQSSVGTQMEAYGDRVSAASNQFYCKFIKEPSRKSCDCQLRVV